MIRRLGRWGFGVISRGDLENAVAQLSREKYRPSIPDRIRGQWQAPPRGAVDLIAI